MNQTTTIGTVQADLVNNVLSAYHTTRMAGVAAAEHVMADHRVQNSFKHLAAVVVAMQNQNQQAAAAEQAAHHENAAKADHQAQMRAQEEKVRASSELRGRAAIAQLAAVRALMNNPWIPEAEKMVLVLDFLDFPAEHIPRSQR